MTFSARNADVQLVECLTKKIYEALDLSPAPG